MVHSCREEQEVGIAHKVESPENQSQFSQIMIGQYWLGPEFYVKLCTVMDGLADNNLALLGCALNKLSEMLSKSYHGIFIKIILTDFLLTTD